MSKLTMYYQMQEDKVNDYRELTYRCWYDHVIYTRNTILSILSNGSDTNDSLARLLKNQGDIGNLLRPFYPSEEIDKIVALLKEHISQAGAIVTTVKSGGDSTALVEQWRNNCHMISQALVDLNPYWNQSSLSSLWDEHLSLTLAEVKFRMQDNWTSDLMNFDEILDNIQEIARILADGIIYQFPLKFCLPIMREGE